MDLFGNLASTGERARPETPEDRRKRLARERQMRWRRRHSFWHYANEDAHSGAEGRER